MNPLWTPQIETANYQLCTSTTRPAQPYEGLMIYELDTNKVYIYDGAAWVLVVGNVIDRAFLTSPVTVSSTAEATGTTIMTSNTKAYANALHRVEFSCPYLRVAGAATGNQIVVSLFEGATQVTRLFIIRNDATTILDLPVYAVSYFTPSAGNHQYTVTGTRTNANCTLTADVGGTGKFGPMVLKISQEA